MQCIGIMEQERGRGGEGTGRGEGDKGGGEDKVRVRWTKRENDAQNSCGFVHARDIRGVNALARVLVQLHGENVVVEKKLQLLVRQVDKKLFKAVRIEDLEAKYIKDAQLLLWCVSIFRRQNGIHPLHNPGECPSIQCFGHGIADILGFKSSQGSYNCLAARDVDGSGHCRHKVR